MNRPQLVLAALASAGPSVAFTPVQVQKIFFLLDRRGSTALGGPHFDFEPYDYGPFDQAVYHELDALQLIDLVQVDVDRRYRTYRLTSRGFIEGSAALAKIAAPVQNFIRQTVLWVGSLRFDQLVAAIYREYPEMKARSIFNQ